MTMEKAYHTIWQFQHREGKTIKEVAQDLASGIGI